MATEDSVKQFQNEGYTVIENFLSPEEISALRQELSQVVEDMNPAEHHQCFTASDPDNKAQSNSEYFLTSGDKIRFFFEEGVLDDKGELLVDKQKSLNKIGHALHVFSPEFKKLCHSEKVKDVARKMQFKQPKICQSMVIFKNARIGGKVMAHQDCTFLYLDGECHVCGFWFALEDATNENGGMWFIPGSHKNGLHNNRRWMRNPDKTGQFLVFTAPPPEYNDADFVSAPVKAGSLVLIDGHVVHKSEANTSEKSRNIFTFHMFESENATWSKDNWLQANGEDHEATFTPLL